MILLLVCLMASYYGKSLCYSWVNQLEIAIFNSKLFVYPLVNKQLDPENNPFSVVSLVFQPR